MRQILALFLSLSLFCVVVYQKPVSGQMDAKGMLASLGGTVLTGIGVTGLMTHTPPCVSEGVMCAEMAMDIGMIAGGILAMMAGQSTADAATGNSSLDNSGLGSGGGGSESGLGDLGNFNYDYGNFNYNSNSGSDPYTTTFCADGTCTIPDDVYKGLDSLANGLSNGTIAPADGMTAAETLDMASSNLAKLEGAISKLQDKLNNDTDNGTNLLGEKSTALASLTPLNFGDDFSGLFKKNTDKTAKSQAPVRINGLDAEDVSSGRKLTIFERATRRYNGTRDYNRAFTVARMELLRKRAKELAKKNSNKKDQLARSPASVEKSKQKNSIAVKTTKE